MCVDASVSSLLPKRRSKHFSVVHSQYFACARLWVSGIVMVHVRVVLDVRERIDACEKCNSTEIYQWKNGGVHVCMSVCVRASSLLLEKMSMNHMSGVCGQVCACVHECACLSGCACAFILYILSPFSVRSILGNTGPTVEGKDVAWWVLRGAFTSYLLSLFAEN